MAHKLRQCPDLLVEFPNDGFEGMEVRPLHGIFGPALPDDLGQLVTWTVIFLQCGAEVRLQTILHVFVDFCKHSIALSGIIITRAGVNGTYFVGSRGQTIVQNHGGAGEE